MLSIVTAVALPNIPAAGFPQPGLGASCENAWITYWFQNSWVWTSSQLDEIRDGFGDWRAPRDWDGDRVIKQMDEVSSNGKVKVVGVSPGYFGDPSQLGSASCGDPSTILLRYDQSGNALEHLARHEMGHALGMHHTGSTDSFGGPMETMATCISFGSTSLSQDDDGHVVYHHGDLNPETIHANAGFETGTSWWGTSSVSSFYTSTYQPEDGSAAGRFRPSSDDGYIYQSMNFAAAQGRKVDARTNIRKVSSQSTYGRVRLELLVRHVVYGTGECADEFVTGKDQNVRSSWTTWWIARAADRYPTASWAILDTTAYTLPTSYDATDLRVRVKSSVRYSSTSSLATIAVDTTRARDRS